MWDIDRIIQKLFWILIRLFKIVWDVDKIISELFEILIELFKNHLRFQWNYQLRMR